MRGSAEQQGDPRTPITEVVARSWRWSVAGRTLRSAPRVPATIPGIRLGLEDVRGLQCVLHGAVVTGGQVGEDHHVLLETGRDGEDIRVVAEQGVTHIERDTHDDVGGIQLSRHQATPELPAGGATRVRAPDTGERRRRFPERIQVHVGTLSQSPPFGSLAESPSGADGCALTLDPVR